MRSAGMHGGQMAPAQTTSLCLLLPQPCSRSNEPSAMMPTNARPCSMHDLRTSMHRQAEADDFPTD